MDIYKDALNFNNIGDWRKIVGYVPQDTILIDDSIAKKIRVSLKNKLKDFYLIKKFKPLLKIIFFKFSVLIKFFENRKEIKKYKKYFD